jgi:hypothetical protein
VTRRRAVSVAIVLLGLSACDASPDRASPAATSGVAASASVAAASSASVAAADASSSLARWDGYGALRLGMDEASFRRAWAGELKGGAAAGSDCAVWTPSVSASPALLSFMLEHGRFVRYDVRGVAKIAPGGGQVGMSRAAIEQRYAGRVSASPHKYEAGAVTLRVAEASTPATLLFEVGADGKVSGWRVGLPPQVDYVEGCG